ncbi:MAG: CusA/CzcA family heavy metal efflux RND transporter [Bacteroidales bacterium]
MINKIISFSLRNRLIIGILTIALIAWGSYNFTVLSIDAVPDITNNQVQVITVAPSLAPQEVEQFITFPVEIAMANIQDVVEIRSISRFGLSVVTIVFKDNVDHYLARQMVSEQIKIAEGDIPEGYGMPEMMPVTTGLGEIYQYVIEAEPGYEDVYTPMELRTIQDWIIKRQLSGIPGIVEISSFGGFLKQYEVTIKPRTLVGMDITVPEIFEALVKNNENSGGSYIEKGPELYYIRAEGLIENKEDIENIIVKNIDDVAVLVKDIAEVNISAPPRYGAMTKDGKGEAVGGITLMLKGANSAKVIGDVKERMEKVKKTLPEGVSVHAYLDRSELISKTIRTVRNNLVEGGLIVIFILILLLGNYRAGLIVASVIPLSMLFAFSMMNLFGVSASLMSLGAIDFGLIVDGSVIVVEGIVYQIHKNTLKRKLTPEELRENIYIAGSKVSKSAVFGVLIILIVYIPILAFSGIEGKMFRPMAQTVIFALLGALILSLTYVPMISSLVLSRKTKEKRNIADRIIAYMQRAHKPVLEFSLRNKILLIGLVLIVLALSFYQFSRMGGEFIPTLEEGDLAAQMTLSPGSSLSESIASTTRAEKILLTNFPEVKEVVSKIGTAEVPTDPMAIEDADIMIIMKPKEEWVSAKTREEMMDKMKSALSVLPGVSFDFTQPIQLRFNELMTGVKADVAVKIFGEDLGKLSEKAHEAAGIINDVKGAGDVRVEQITGMPQLRIKYKRDQLAQFGLNVKDINRIIRIGYGGEVAGIVYEGERRFDLVLRLCEECRNEMQSIENLRVNSPSGEFILLQQVADIEITSGPMQISRDDTKRRITIGINVRNRDVESFIDEVNRDLEQDLQLPPGYYLSYGGDFENLQNARRTSSFAVPVSLLVILVLLYFAFYSLKQALMIYTAIPLAAVGGIWALYLRGMPFSISAGVGFIALFGVAVLNGIVLISYYNQLKKEGVNDIYERVRRGTRLRLRPVVMTASVAALGFLPMALSTAPGAEVQKPLATVVIGGLITATFLTLVVLPVVYILFDRIGNGRNNIRAMAFILIMLGSGNFLMAQDAGEIDLNRAVHLALEHNLTIENARMELEMAGKMKKTAIDLPSPEVDYERGQINSALDDHRWLITQSFHFPLVYASQYKWQKENELLAEKNLKVIQTRFMVEASLIYLNWLKAIDRESILCELDSLYRDFMEILTLKYEKGDIGYLSVTMAESKVGRIRNQLLQGEIDVKIKARELQKLMGIKGDWIPLEGGYIKLPAPSMPARASAPLLGYYRQQIELKRAAVATHSMKLFPDLRIGYFNQTLDKETGFEGWVFGLNFPLWFWSDAGKIQASQLDKRIAENEFYLQERSVRFQKERLMQELIKKANFLEYFEKDALEQAAFIKQHAMTSFRNGEISYLEFIQLVSEALDIRLEYLDAMHDYNRTILEIAGHTGTLNFINTKGK